MNEKRKRIELTVKKKYEIIKYVETMESCNRNIVYKNIASQFGVKPTTLSDLLKRENREKIKQVTGINCLSNSIKRIKHSQYELTNKALFEWLTGIRNSRPDISVTGDMLKITANEFAKELNEICHDKEIDINWINRWKLKYEVSSKKLCGESASISHEVVDTWKNQTLSQILSKYEPRNIFNCDECGLFWRLTPDKTLAFKSEKVHGGKKSKDRITVLMTVSMSGEKFPLWVVGKFAKPRCFKNIEQLPLIYHSNKKAWITTEIFTAYLRKFDSEMVSQGRKIALVLDRCTAHPNLSSLKNIELFFLPPNSTSRTQPLDAGIINSMKCFYRKKLLNRLLSCYNSKIEFNFNLLDAINLLKPSWDAVTTTTIIKCFTHVGFYTNSTLENFHEEEEQINISFENVKNILNVTGDFQDFVNVDCNIPTTAEVSISEIVSMLKVEKHKVDDDNVEEKRQQIKSNEEILAAFQTIKAFLDHSEKITDPYDKSFNELMIEVENITSTKSKQSKITSYFSK